MCSARDKNRLNPLIAMFEQILECGFISTLEIAGDVIKEFIYNFLR